MITGGCKAFSLVPHQAELSKLADGQFNYELRILNVELRIVSFPEFGMNEKKNVIKDKSYRFAIEIVHLYKGMIRQKEFVLSSQIVRSGTSIGANVEEAIAAQSRKDFISKMSIASKEAREINYWLRLLKDTKLVNANGIDKLLKESDEMIRIITSIVKSSKERNAF
jgi:four helix bundle protein